jgi:hypothetical protein
MSGNRYHRQAIIDELATAYPDQIAKIAFGFENGIDVTEVLTSDIREWLEANPDALVWPIDRATLFHLEVRLGPPNLDRAYITANVDRMDPITRWRRARELIRKADADVNDLFERDPETGNWKLIGAAPLMQKTITRAGGRPAHRCYVEVRPEEVKPTMSEGERQCIRAAEQHKAAHERKLQEQRTKARPPRDPAEAAAAQPPRVNTIGGK